MSLLALFDETPLGQVYPPMSCPQTVPDGEDGQLLSYSSGSPLGVAWVAPGESAPARQEFAGTTLPLLNLDTGSLEIQGYKTYILTSIEIDYPARCRIYTDNTSRASDAGRSIGTDPAPGSGLIAEVVTVNPSYIQKITPFVIGGNLDNPVTDTLYLSVTNQSGVTRAINVSLTLLKVE